MKNELRLGNYLLDANDRLCRVEQIGTDCNYGFKAPAIVGGMTSLPNFKIKLSNEWLESFGLEKAGKITYKFSYPLNLFRFVIEKQTENEYIVGIVDEMSPSGEDIHYFKWNIQYVHEFQNFMFALTGMQLTQKTQSNVSK